jgi:nucleotide-binding universal stress UspA family protein
LGEAMTDEEIYPHEIADIFCLGLVFKLCFFAIIKILNDVYERLKDMGVPLETKLVWGNPADIICEEAKEAKYDLIVMGSRGLSQIKSYLLGSVSSRVTRHAPCPVLIVR